MLSTTWDAGALNRGVASWNDARGLGFMMFSEENATTRFVGNNINNAEHFVPVRFRNDSTWQYNNNRGWVNFQPRETDVLVAHLNFSLNTATSLENVNTRIGGVQTGYDDGDIVVIAGRWNGWERPEEFTVLGTSFTTFTSGDDVLLAGYLNHGVRVPDSATGTAYMIYSKEVVGQRFPDSGPFQAQHFFAARMASDQWQYATDSGWVPFQPRNSDLVIAELNLDDDSVKLWKGIRYTVDGIAGGFHDGDITIAGGQLAGKATSGQFEVFGSYKRTHRYFQR